jgi:hypothetical protein
MALTMPSAAGAQTLGYQTLGHQTLGHQTLGHHWSVSVVASHLNNPRGLPPAPGGGLYLAEAGSGGSTCLPGGEQGTT